MKNILTFLQKVDTLAPNPWIVDGVKQSRPTTQLGLLIGVMIGIIICCLLF